MILAAEANRPNPGRRQRRLGARRAARRYYRALEHAELRRIRFHDLRHCFGSAAITKLDAYAVQSYMGHQHYCTTQRYLHHKPRPQDAAALHEAFGGEDVSPDVSRTDAIQAN